MWIFKGKHLKLKLFIWSTRHSTPPTFVHLLVKNEFLNVGSFRLSKQTMNRPVLSLAKSRSINPCVIERNKWKFEGVMSGEYGGWGNTFQFNYLKISLTTFVLLVDALSRSKIIFPCLRANSVRFVINECFKLINSCY